MLALLPWLVLTTQSPPVQLQVDQVESWNERRLAVRIEADAPLSTLGEGHFSGLLHSSPPLLWQCFFEDETAFSCYTEEAAALPPASRIELRITPGALIAQNGRPVAGLVDTIVVRQAALETITLGLDARGLPQLVLFSKQLLRRDSLINRIVLRQGSQEWTLQLREMDARTMAETAEQGGSPSLWGEMKQAWTFDWPTDLRPGEELQLIGKPGIAVQGGQIPTEGEQRILAWTAPAHLELQIACVYSGSCDRDGPLELKVNTRPNARTLAELLFALPAGMRLTDRTPQLRERHQSGLFSHELVWPITVERAGHRYSMPIPKHWRGGLGQPPAADRLQFTSGPLPPSLDISPDLLVLPLGTAAPIQHIRWANTAQFDLLLRSLGRDADLPLITQHLRPAAALEERSAPLRRAPTQLRRSGGTQWGALRRTEATADDSTDLPLNLAGVGRAWADVGLHALVYDQQIQLVSTDLYSAEPLADVALDWLQQDLQAHSHKQFRSVLAVGATTSAGQLSLLDAETDGIASTLIRARRGDHNTVLPLQPFTVLARTVDQPPHVDEQRVFTWTDRVSYQPGDTAQLRVLVRMAQPRALAPPPAGQRQWQLHLKQEWPSLVLGELPITLDAFGAASVQWQIPPATRDGRVQVQLLSLDGHADEAEPAAFLVASVDAATLDVGLQLPDGAITPEQLPMLELSAGYFSGGAAVGVDSRVDGLLDAGDSVLRERFATYRFQSDPDAADDADEHKRLEAQAACFGGDDEVSVGISQPLGLTDGEGHSRGQLRLPAFACPLGELKLTPVTRIPGQAEAYGLTQRRVFSREAKLLGLAAPTWASTGQRIEVAAVVVRVADLSALPDASRRIVFERKDGARWSEQQRCEVDSSAGQSHCEWLPQQAGDWRLLLSADGASSVKQAVTVWGDTPQDARAELDGPQARLAPGSNASYALRQPYRAARVLLTVESDGLLHQQWHEVDRSQASLPLLIDPAWAPCFYVAVLVVPQIQPGQPLQPTLADHVRSCVEVPKPTLVDLTVQPLQCSPAPPACTPVTVPQTHRAGMAHPAGWVRVHVKSRHNQALRLSLTAIDAAMLDLDPELRNLRDPHASPFLQREDAGAPGKTYSLLAWAKAPTTATTDLPPENLSLYGGSYWHRGALYEEEEGELAAMGVVGSRISPSDVFGNRQPRLGRRGEREHGSTAITPLMRRIPRQRFADTAFWLPDEPLDPGASRFFDLQLPDNLTRWHIEALAVDAADQFQLASTQIEAGLLLEARALAPARVFVGDRSVLAAQLRNSSAMPRRVVARLDLDGAADHLSLTRNLTLASTSSARLQLPWHATTPGEATLLAQLDDRSDSSGDAVLKPIQIQSLLAPWTQRQAGLLLQSPTVLDLSRVLPAGAPAQLRVQLSRNPLFGLAGLFDQMREYPHRCLEQRLSRALVAHHARALSTLAGTDVGWATQAVIDEPLANLPRYRNADNGLVYFNPDYETADPQLQVYALLVLAELGQRLPEEVHEAAVDAAGELIEALAPKSEPPEATITTPPDADADAAAFALRALAQLQRATPAQFRLVLDKSTQLSAWGSSQLLYALAGNTAFAGERRQLVARVRGLGERNGARIRLRPPAAGEHTSRWLGSDVRDSCAVLGALLASDDNADAHTEHAGWLYDLFDAYGSGLREWDTQTLATCSSSAAAYASRWLRGGPAVAVQLQADERTLLQTQLATSAQQHIDQPLSASERPRLTLQSTPGNDVAYAIELRQQRDRMTLPAAAQGLALDRQAEVWRGGKWLPVPNAVVRVGDWLRVRLVVNTAQSVNMVALSDSVPGGLRAINKSLEGVSDAQIQQADEGSFWFFERQLGSTDARFYATQLPAGRHEILYYTQARHPGRYAWPGASAELMYNLQRHGRSAAAVLEIEAADSDHTAP